MRKILLVALLLIPLLSFGQNDQEIKGRIIDEQTGVPILGANIIEKGTTNGTTTDIDGEFTITVPLSATLEISYIGYGTREIKVGQLELDQISNLSVDLEPETSGLDEVVVVGYGQQSKVSMVGAVETVEPDKLRTASTNITSALAGNLAGVIGFQRTGQPGADAATFYIRGISTYNGVQNPLILLDGVEISSGDLVNIAPEIIESVSILKDATATAVYGNRGANGVLIVTTKTGKNLEKPRIYARVQSSISAPTKAPTFADGAQYMQLFNQAVTERRTGERLYTKDQINGTLEGRNPYVYPNVNWYDELFKSHAINEEANVNIQGGGKKVGYFMSATFNNQTGLLRSFDQNSYSNNIEVQKFTFQNNIDAELSPTTKVSLKLNTQLRYEDGPATDVQSIYNNVMNTNPVDFPTFFPADSVADARNTLFGGKSGGTTNSGFVNPFAELSKGYKNDFRSTVLATLSGEQKLDFITPGLKFNALFSFKNWSQTVTTRSRGYNQYQVNRYEQLADGSYDYELERIGEPQGLSLGTENANNGDRRLKIQPSLQYSRAFDNHHVGGLLLYNQDELAFNAPTDLISSLPKRRMGYTARVTYDYDNRYLFEANGAYNGSENFAKNRRFGFFPSVAVGYAISNEKFFNSEAINFLKIKASWGRVGNDDIGGSRFPYLSNIDLTGRGFTTGIDQNNTFSGPVYNQFENLDITWETEDKLNLGLELNLFNDFRFNFDYYINKRVDIFDNISRTIPDVFGTAGTDVFANMGEVHNEGVDVALDFNKSISKDFHISAKGTFTYSHNTIKKNNEPSFSEYPNLSAIGHSIGTLWGYRAERLFIDQAEVDASPTQQLGGSDVSGGDIKYTDLTGDGLINSNDREAMGKPTVPEIIYGLSVTSQYKDFDLSFLLQGAARTSFFMSNFHPFGTTGIRNVLQWIADDHYSSTNPDIYAGYPKLSKADNGNNTVNSSFWLRDGSFLKLRSAEVGYNLNQFRFFVSGYNLLTFSKFNKWDPEEGGGSGLKYPTQRIINVGVQMRFN